MAIIYSNFICYRGGSSAGSFLGEEIYFKAKQVEEIIGKTYYSLEKEDPSEVRNFLNDPKKYMCDIKNFVMILTKGFLSEFLLDGEPNPKSVTRIEIDEALKNKNLRFIPIQFQDFSWEDSTDGYVNRDILVKLWSEEGADRIIGSPAIKFDLKLKYQIIDNVVFELSGQSRSLSSRAETIYTLDSTPSVLPKPIFCGREKELERIKELFDSGDRVIFLQGIGGIGKTEIAKQYARRNKDDYDTVVYATYTSSIADLISSQNYFKLTPNFPRLMLGDGTQENDVDYFKRKLNEIKKTSNSRTLIIIDNFDVMDDEYFDLLIDAKYRMLITTRCDYSRTYPAIKIEPLNDIDQLKHIFLENYKGHFVDYDDPQLEELLDLVNRHTYTIELIAQHMERSCQTIDEMIDVLKSRGIVSLDEEVKSKIDNSKVAYENLLKMFKVFDLDDDDKNVLKVLSLMPLTGVNIVDLKSWIGVKGIKTVIHLEERSWVSTISNRVSLHPIIRDVVRHELGFNELDLASFLTEFNETIKEQKSWHYDIEKRRYYAEIAAEIIKRFDKINENTFVLYKNCELLFSFGTKPSQAIELGEMLFDYFEKNKGPDSFECAYYAFQIGWTYLFNMQLPDAVENANKWFNKSFEIFKCLKLSSEDEFAYYGHLLTHICRTNLILYQRSGEKIYFDDANKIGELALDNAIKHFGPESQYYSRIAVAYMQLSEVYVVSKEFDKALKCINSSYDIIVSLFGEDDSDTLNVCNRKALILYNLGNYKEALELSKKNLELYNKYFGELNYLRLEQLLTAFRCSKRIGDSEETERFRNESLKLANQLLSPNSNVFIELK